MNFYIFAAIPIIRDFFLQFGQRCAAVQSRAAIDSAATSRKLKNFIFKLLQFTFQRQRRKCQAWLTSSQRFHAFVIEMLSGNLSFDPTASDDKLYQSMN